jgi:hypothetical protein
VNVFSPTLSGDQEWSTCIGFASNVPTGLINGVNNTIPYYAPLPGTNAGFAATLEVVPAAFSVQVMNGNPLQTTTGIIAAAVCPTSFDLNDNARTWNAFADAFVSYMKPRLLTAPKLALRGIHMDSYPMDMNDLSEFAKTRVFTAIPTTLNGTITPAGMAPIVVINEDETDLTYLVAVEWRVRFDWENPAVASHTSHGSTP